MRKSLVVELVLLNSVLAISGCTKVCPAVERKELPPGERTTWDDEDYPVAQNTCRGRSSSGYYGGGAHGIYIHGGGGGGRTTTRPGTGTVGRGGFGSAGHAVS